MMNSMSSWIKRKLLKSWCYVLLETVLFSSTLLNLISNNCHELRKINWAVFEGSEKKEEKVIKYIILGTVYSFQNQYLHNTGSISNLVSFLGLPQIRSFVHCRVGAPGCSSHACFVMAASSKAIAFSSVDVSDSCVRIQWLLKKKKKKKKEESRF